jgi:hypothetical protein
LALFYLSKKKKKSFGPVWFSSEKLLSFWVILAFKICRSKIFGYALERSTSLKIKNKKKII